MKKILVGMFIFSLSLTSLFGKTPNDIDYYYDKDNNCISYTSSNNCVANSPEEFEVWVIENGEPFVSSSGENGIRTPEFSVAGVPGFKYEIIEDTANNYNGEKLFKVTHPEGMRIPGESFDGTYGVSAVFWSGAQGSHTMYDRDYEKYVTNRASGYYDNIMSLKDRNHSYVDQLNSAIESWGYSGFSAGTAVSSLQTNYTVLSEVDIIDEDGNGKSNVEINGKLFPISKGNSMNIKNVECENKEFGFVITIKNDKSPKDLFFNSCINSRPIFI